MRILIVSREYPPATEGGISRRLSNLVPRLMDRGLDVGVVCFGGSTLTGERIYSLDANSKILYTRTGEPSVGDAASVLKDIWRLDRYASNILSSEQYDLVQVEEPVFGPFISSRVPRIVTVHTTQLGEFYALRAVFNNVRQLKRLIFSGTFGWMFDRLCLRDADFVVAVGPAIRAELQMFYGGPQENVQVVPNGVTCPEVLNKAEVKRQLGIDNLLFVYAGRLVDRKRIDDFLRAISMLRQDGFEDISALVVGSGPVSNILANLAANLSITDCVRFTGHVDDNMYFNIMEAADVFVLPSCYESALPIAVLEAMAYGCVPIVTNIPHIFGTIRAEETGLVYPVGDVKALSNALRKVSTDNGLRASISNCARKDAASFSWSNMEDAYLRIYDRVLR